MCHNINTMKEKLFLQQVTSYLYLEWVITSYCNIPVNLTDSSVKTHQKIVVSNRHKSQKCLKVLVKREFLGVSRLFNEKWNHPVIVVSVIVFLVICHLWTVLHWSWKLHTILEKWVYQLQNIGLLGRFRGVDLGGAPSIPKIFI